MGRSSSKHRHIILTIWLVGFFVSMVLLFYVDLHWFRAVPSAPETFREPINALYAGVPAAYSVYLSTMLTFNFMLRRAAKRTDFPAASNGMPKRFDRNGGSTAGHLESRTALFYTALALSTFWNVGYVAMIAATALFARFDVQDLAKTLDICAKSTAFLITPIIAAYFSPLAHK